MGHGHLTAVDLVNTLESLHLMTHTSEIVNVAPMLGILVRLV